MIRTDHANCYESTSGLMKPGEYECIVTDIRESATKGGTPYVSVDLVVRNDVEQEYRNKHIWDSLWLSEKAAPISAKKINAIDKALKMPEAEYADYTEWGQACAGKPCRIRVSIQPARDGYEARERIDWYRETTAPEVAHVWKAKPQPNEAFTPVKADDDLPF